MFLFEANLPTQKTLLSLEMPLNIKGFMCT
jgi:hypothetical protein